MAAQHLRQSDYATVPWKNGLGSTQELASEAVAADAGFLWRISIADMPADCAFSRFPDTERILTVIEGGGLTLTGDMLRAPVVCHPFCPTTFSGDDALLGQLHAGAVKNFNVMVARRHAEAHVDVVVPSAGTEREIVAPVNFFHVPASSQSVSVACAGQQVLLQPGDSYLLKGKKQSPVVVSSDVGSRLLHVAITC